MGDPVVHFDIGCRDRERTGGFYCSLFGWSTAEQNPFSSWLSTHSDKGITGAVTSLGHEPHNYMMIYVEVENIEASIEKALTLGGEKLIPPTPIPDGRRFAWLKDPEGTTFGLLGP